MSFRFTLILIVGVFLLNNGMWLYWVNQQNTVAEGRTGSADVISASNVEPCQGAWEDAVLVDLAVALAAEVFEEKHSKPFERSLPEAESEAFSPPGAALDDQSITELEVRDYALERELDMTFFFAVDKQKKLEILHNLTSQGEDLQLLEEILREEGDTTVRTAAVHKLNGQRSYAATRVLLDTLNDPVDEVALTALNTLVINGDRSLIPLLQQRMETLPSGAVRDYYSDAIGRFEQSVTMGMDES